MSVHTQAGFRLPCTLIWKGWVPCVQLSQSCALASHHLKGAAAASGQALLCQSATGLSLRLLLPLRWIQRSQGRSHFLSQLLSFHAVSVLKLDSTLGPHAREPGPEWTRSLLVVCGILYPVTRTDWGPPASHVLCAENERRHKYPQWLSCAPSSPPQTWSPVSTIFSGTAQQHLP